MFDFFPNAVIDIEKYRIPLSSLKIDTPSISRVYFGLLYKIINNYIFELYTSGNSDKVLLIDNGGLPLLSATENAPPTSGEWQFNILPPYLVESSKYAITLVFSITQESPLLLVGFPGITELSQLLSWNFNDVLFYRYGNYFPNWENIPSSQLILYLLNLGLSFKKGQTYQAIYFDSQVIKFIEGEEFAYYNYQFSITFKGDLPSYYDNISAQEVI